MKSIKAARIHNYGGPEVVRVESTSLPGPQTGQVLIRVHAAGVNPIDWKIRAGYLQQMMPVAPPFTLGGDFSGVVESAGPGISGFKAGDEVYGQAPVISAGSGSFAESLIVAVGSIAGKPPGLSHTEAAVLPLAGVSALQAVKEVLSLSPGQKVLIHGGAGGIGSIAIQLAKHLGARVATTVSSRNVDYVKKLDADEIIDYGKQRFEQAFSDLDAVFDTVGGDTYERSFHVLKSRGRMVSMLERPRQDLMSQYGVEAIVLFTQVTSDRLAQLSRWIDQDALQLRIDRTFPLDEAAAALQYQEKASPKGKAVIVIA
jgi:NADPH:quinone reductase-like Zn-dependent oxidoreductase